VRMPCDPVAPTLVSQCGQSDASLYPRGYVGPRRRDAHSISDQYIDRTGRSAGGPTAPPRTPAYAHLKGLRRPVLVGQQEETT